MKYRNLQYIKGEISTLIIMGMLVIAGVGVLMSSSFGQNKHTTNTQASTVDCPLGVPSFVSGSNHFAQTTLPVCQVTVPAKEKEYVCAIIQDDNPNDGGKDDILIAAQDPKGGQANTINWIWKNGVGSVPLYKYVDTIDASKTLKIVTYSFKNPTCVTTTTIPASTVASLFAGNNSRGDPDGWTIPTNTLAPKAPTNTPTTQPLTPTPQCQQENYVYCPGTSVCVPALYECEGVPTNTPVPTSTTAPTPTTSSNTQTPTNITCPISGLYIEVDGKTITKFETLIAKSSEYGPKVAHANSNGAKQGHIAGESIGSTFWGPGSTDIDKFESIDLGSGETHHFYVEVVKRDGSNCAEQAFSCSNNNGTVLCSVMSATTATFQTTEDRNTQGEIVNTSYGTGIVIGG